MCLDNHDTISTGSLPGNPVVALVIAGHNQVLALLLFCTGSTDTKEDSRNDTKNHYRREQAHDENLNRLVTCLSGLNLCHLGALLLDKQIITSGAFTATQFYADIEGHPSDTGVQNAFEELDFFTDYFRVLGVYPAAESK